MTAILRHRSVEPEDHDLALRLRDIVAWGEPWDYEDDDVEGPAPAAG